MTPLVPAAVAQTRLRSAEAAVATPPFAPRPPHAAPSDQVSMPATTTSDTAAAVHVGATKPDRKTGDADVRADRLPDLVVVAFDTKSDDMRDADLARAASNVGTMIANRSARSFSSPVGVVSLELQGLQRLLTAVGRETGRVHWRDAVRGDAGGCIERHPLHDVENLKLFDATNRMANALRWAPDSYRELAYRLSGATEPNMARAQMIAVAAWLALIASAAIALVKFTVCYGDPSFYLSLADFLRPDSVLADFYGAAVDGSAWRRRATELLSLALGTCVRGLLFVLVPLVGTHVREPIATLVLFAANVASLAGVRLAWCVATAAVVLCLWHAQWREWYRHVSRVTLRHTPREISEIFAAHAGTRCRDWAAKELVRAHMKRLGKRHERHNCLGRDGLRVDAMVDGRDGVRDRIVRICSLCRAGSAIDQALVVVVDTVDSGRRLVAAYKRQRSIVGGTGDGAAYFLCVTRNAVEWADADAKKRRDFESIAYVAPTLAALATTSTATAPKPKTTSPTSGPTNLCSEMVAVESRAADAASVDGDAKRGREQAERRRRCHLLMGVSSSSAASRNDGVTDPEDVDENEAATAAAATTNESENNASSGASIPPAAWIVPDLVLEYSGEMAPFLESASGHLARPLALAPTAV